MKTAETAKTAKRVTEYLLAMSDSMLDETAREEIELYDKVYANDFMAQRIEIRDADSFNTTLVQPFESFLNGVIRKGMGINNDDVNFILIRYEFLSHHFEGLFTRFDGMGHVCCADKKHNVIYRLVDFFKTGKTIEFIDTEESFGYPKLILRTQEDILDMYYALKALYYGRVEKYLEILAKIIPKS